MLIRSFSLISILVILFIPRTWNGARLNDLSAGKYSRSFFYVYPDTTYKIISSIAGTYGYEISTNGKSLIRQKTIPGLAGSMGFKRKTDAAKAAQLVLKKLRAGSMPPSIDKHELDSMKIRY